MRALPCPLGSLAGSAGHFFLPIAATDRNRLHRRFVDDQDGGHVHGAVAVNDHVNVNVNVNDHVNVNETRRGAGRRRPRISGTDPSDPPDSF
jgi:hypothetical protein